MLQGMMPYDLAALVRTQLFARSPEAFANDPFAALATATLRMPTLNYHPVQAKDGRWLQLGNLLQHLFIIFSPQPTLPMSTPTSDTRARRQPGPWRTARRSGTACLRGCANSRAMSG